MIVRVRILVCVCVCPFSKRVSGGSKIGENASNAAMELWLSAKSLGWRLLAALLFFFFQYESSFFLLECDDT